MTTRGVLAYAYATKFRDRPAYRYVVETSVYVAGPMKGQGAGRLVYEALVDTLRAQGFTQAIGVLSLPNDHSIKLHEEVGFRRAGVFRDVGFKQGRWIDVGYWQCQLNDSRVPPVEPKPFSAVGWCGGSTATVQQVFALCAAPCSASRAIARSCWSICACADLHVEIAQSPAGAARRGPPLGPTWAHVTLYDATD